MQENFEICELDSQGIETIVSQWTKAKASDIDIDKISMWAKVAKCSCMSVEDTKGNIYAVFDIHEAPAHIKTMDVIFSPKYNFNPSGQKADTLEKEFERLVYVLFSIFDHVVKLSNKWGVVKIYNNTREVGVIFSGFATSLQKQQPQYEVKLYSKWVEISNRETLAKAKKGGK